MRALEEDRGEGISRVQKELLSRHLEARRQVEGILRPIDCSESRINPGAKEERRHLNLERLLA